MSEATVRTSECRLQYQGDGALAGLLAKAASPYDVAGLRALLRGVVWAAPQVDPRAWCALVANDPSPALVAQLNALRERVEAEERQSPAAPDHARRLADLRAGMRAQGIDAFLVPRTDEYQNEYVPACSERLAWLTGFTGSAGMAVVLADRAAVFVDGRYTVQVRAQTDAALFEPHHLIEEPPETWLAKVLKADQVLGYDAWLMTPAQVDRFRQAVETMGAACRAVAGNPLDEAWTDRPAVPLGPVVPHPLEFAGKPSAEKRRDLAAGLTRDRRHVVVLTAADSIAWLLNLRGADVSHSPLALGFALADDAGRVSLFIDPRKLAPGLTAHLGPEVTILPLDAFGPALAALSGKTVQVDATTAAAWILDRLTAAGATVARAADPVSLPKAMKNPVELAGIRESHKRDGVAMARFLHWLDGQDTARLWEIEASDRLELFRREGDRFRDLSFPTISAAGPDAALPHYRAEPGQQRRLEPDSLYLVDSGAQYLDGTTDITRTVALGTPTAEMKDRYTRVLKGHIALARAVFPKGTTGTQLDVLARMPLWQAGVTYDHGTGHGVGSYLGVHEGPQRISGAPSTQALLPGMLVSNEPGFYKAGGFGIRIENLVLVAPVEIAGAEREMLGFETVTLCPIDTRPIDLSLMTAAEVAWLDTYHARVREALGPLLADPAALEWLERVTAPLG